MIASVSFLQKRATIQKKGKKRQKNRNSLKPNFDSSDHCPLFKGYSRETFITRSFEDAADLYEWNIYFITNLSVITDEPSNNSERVDSNLSHTKKQTPQDIL